MSKATVAGILIWIVAGVIYVFKLISNIMGRKFHYSTLEQIFGIKWIEEVPFEVLQNALTVVATSRLTLVLLITGLLFIIIGMFKKI